MVSVRRWSSLSLRLVLSLLVLLLVPVAVPGSPVVAERVRVLVEASGLDAAVAAVEAHEGSVAQVLPRFGVAIADVPAHRVARLMNDSRISSVITDAPMRTTSSIFGPSGRPSTATVNAPTAWDQGITGAGVTVAVVDTGVADHPDLGDRLVAAVDVSGENVRGDGHGHGTFMAGLVAGDGTSGDGPTGVAPDADIVSVKVADRHGNTSLSIVLAGLHAVSELHEPLGIDVVLLALAAEAPGKQDPVGAALKRLWGQGLVVVVAAGNEGPHAGSVASPGRDPYLLTVGAVDDRGTTGVADDVVPSWSSVGAPDLPAEKPEVVAPGASVASLRAPGSVIDLANPAARIGDWHFRGSGSSMSAALTAGAAALVLDAQSELSPDEVKGRLMAGAAPAPSDAPEGSAGRGVVDVVGALAADGATANGDLPPVPRTSDAGNTDSGRTEADDRSGEQHDQGPASWQRTVDGDWTAWTWKAWTWKAWTWKAWTWKAWTWKSSTWTAMTWE